MKYTLGTATVHHPAGQSVMVCRTPWPWSWAESFGWFLYRRTGFGFGLWLNHLAELHTEEFFVPADDAALAAFQEWMWPDSDDDEVEAS